MKFLILITLVLFLSCENPIFDNLLQNKKAERETEQSSSPGGNNQGGNNNDDPPVQPGTFVSVTDITNLSTYSITGELITLSGTIVPANATNKSIIWNLKDGTAIIAGNNFFSNADGTVTVEAIIENGRAVGINFVKEFEITVQRSVPFTITFTADQAPEIADGITIYLTGGVGRPTAATITVDNPAQYSSINWFVSGTSVSGSGSSFTLNSANPVYGKKGTYYLTVEVMKNGQPFGTTVMFEVAE